jgi:hypothetical protein
VELKGYLKSGNVAGGTEIVVLPAGYRPSLTKYFVAAAPGFAILKVESSGAVRIDTLTSTDNSFLSLNNVRFTPN